MEVVGRPRAAGGRTMAVVVLDVANPFFTDVVRGAELATAERDMVVIVCNTGEDATRERRHLELLEEQRVRGILITPVDDRCDSRLEHLIARGTPVVLVDRGTGRPNRCSVAVDDVLGGRLAGAHLAALGHRRIAFVGGPFHLSQVADRHAGIVSALAERVAVSAYPSELDVIATPSLGLAAGRDAAARITERPPGRRPTGVFCANDLLALGVLDGLTRRGLRVPRDVALVGYDDIDFAAATAVPLTSVRQPRELLGRTAAQLLLEEIDQADRHEHRHVIFEPDLVVRESTVPGRGGAG